MNYLNGPKNIGASSNAALPMDTYIHGVVIHRVDIQDKAPKCNKYHNISI
jgi:hypothetical protein